VSWQTELLDESHKFQGHMKINYVYKLNNHLQRRI